MLNKALLVIEIKLEELLFVTKVLTNLVLNYNNLVTKDLALAII